MTYQTLSWDTSFFGFKIAKIAAPHLDRTDLFETLSDMRTEQIKLAYWPATKPLDNATLTASGGFLADKKRTYAITLQAAQPISPHIHVETYTPAIPMSEMEYLAIESAKYSRFFLDPNFERAKSEELYRIWIRNSIARKNTREILVIREQERIAGMITLTQPHEWGEIGLLAVAPNFTGKRYGESLVKSAQNWFLSHGIKAVRVVTQGDNMPACRLYEKCGFNVKKIEYFYHFWL